MENNRGKYLIHPETFAPKILFRFRASAQTDTAEHVDDYLMLIVCLSGRGQIVVEGTNYEMKKGDIAVINAGDRHAILRSGAVFGYICYDNICPEGMKKNSILRNQVVITPQRFEKEIQYCLSTTTKVADKKEIGWEALANVLCVELLLWVQREVLPGEKEKREESFHVDSYERESIVKMMMAYFNKNYMHHISMMEMAKGAYLSTTYLTRIFKEYCGQSPIDYLIGVRLRHACELLEQDQISVQDTAKQVGYDDPYYFSKLFSKHMGVSPSQYKKGMRPKGEETA